MSRCDADEGLADGMIMDPRTCDFDPATLASKGDKMATCPTKRQVDAVVQVCAAGPQRGSELYWIGPHTGADGGRGRYYLAHCIPIPSRPVIAVRATPHAAASFGAWDPVGNAWAR